MTIVTPVRTGVSLDALLAAKNTARRDRLTGSRTTNNRSFLSR